MKCFDSEPLTRSQFQGWFDRKMRHKKEHGYGPYVVYLRDPKTFIGNLGLTHIVVDGEPVLELGYDFKSEFWGQGYATESALALSCFAIETGLCQELVCMIRKHNKPSITVAKRLGMRWSKDVDEGGISYCMYRSGRLNPGIKA